MNQARALATFARDPREGENEITLVTFERSLLPRVFELGCTVVALFLSG